LPITCNLSVDAYDSPGLRILTVLIPLLSCDKWGSNYAFKEQAKEDLFDPSNPFGE